jgi:hypothetical protein
MEKAKRVVKAKGAAKKGAKVADKGAHVVAKVATAPKAEKAVKTAEVSATPTKGRGLVAYRNNQPSPYAGLQGVAKGAYTLAALIVAGLVKKVGEGFELANGGSMLMLREITGLPNQHHRANGNFADGKLTKQGLQWFTQRVRGEGPTYNTMSETVDTLVTAMRESGIRNIEGRRIEITKKVIVD